MTWKSALTLNNDKYFISFQKQKDIGSKITMFHRYKPNKYIKNPDNFKGKIIYFHGKSTSTQYINVVTVKIKNRI